MNTPTHRALIVDDEPDIRELLGITLQRMGLKTASAEDVTGARRLLAIERFDVCLTDMRLPDGNGIDLVRHIQDQYPDLPVAVITAHGNMELAIEALKAGAFDFVSKPVDLQALRALVQAALRLPRQHTEVQVLAGTELIGESAAIHETRGKIDKLARSQAPVYISGESGVGKELVARLIHTQSPRADKPFVPVNCGAIPHDLLESEFFGHVKGSFTGAMADKQGLFQAADGGTLFLDEVAELPLHMQVKLLRAIQEKTVRPIGARSETRVDVRILSATHKNLGDMVQKGEFRQDLFYRINVIELHVPSLRERPEDVPLLGAHILRKLSRETGADVPVLTDEATHRLARYEFPGNVRELENILERAMTMCEHNTIKAEDLHLPEHSPATPDFLQSSQSLEDYLEEVERRLLTQALEKARYNKTAAARLLGITFRALRYRLKKLGME